MDTTIRTLFEVYPPQPKATIPYGIRVNDMVYGGAINGSEPVSGRLSTDVQEQMRVALTKVKDLVESSGGSLDNVARATGFCTTEEHRRLIDEVWMEVYPDEQDKPAFKQILGSLPEGHLVALECQALIGERRQRIDIPNISAHDPTIKIGNWLFTSRCHGNDPATGKVVEGGLEAQTVQTLDNLVTLAKLAGGSQASIVAMTMFGRSKDYMPTARRIFEERFADPSRRPALNQLVNFISGSFEVSIEMAAVL